MENQPCVVSAAIPTIAHNKQHLISSLALLQDIKNRLSAHRNRLIGGMGEAASIGSEKPLDVDNMSLKDLTYYASQKTDDLANDIWIIIGQLES